MAALRSLAAGVHLRPPRLRRDLLLRAKRPTARGLHEDLLLAVREHADADRVERIKRLVQS